MYKKILIGVDDSENSLRAVKAALERSKIGAPQIVAFHSVMHHVAELNMGFTLPSVGNPNAGYSLHQDYLDAGKRAIKKAEEIFKKDNQEWL